MKGPVLLQVDPVLAEAGVKLRASEDATATAFHCHSLHIKQGFLIYMTQDIHHRHSLLLFSLIADISRIQQYCRGGKIPLKKFSERDPRATLSQLVRHQTESS